MHEKILLISGLLIIVFLLVMLAQRLNIAYPIFLVVAGLGIGFIPHLPAVHLDPEIIFLIFLPPLLYEAAWFTSWRDFWKWKRPIALLAFGLVFLTSLAVAYVAHAFVPGFTLALGFLLGGIISPPDAVAATTVMKGLKVPRRTLVILEGESLVNDASSLIVFRFALAAVITGTFSLSQAIGDFFMAAGMGVVIGLIGAHLMYAAHRFLPTTPAIDAVLTVMTPYLLFLSAEHFHFSGVLAVVSGGLFMSYRSHEVFRTGSTRVNMQGVWHTLIFAMNTLVFILIGLELPTIVGGLGKVSLWQGIKYGLIISFAAIAVRLLWIFLIAYLPQWLPGNSGQEPSTGWKNPLILGWAGMRGVISLATALSIPLLMSDGTAFPHRSMIVFITFVAIFVTLVIQGITLPILVKLIDIKELDSVLPAQEQRSGIQLRLDIIAIHRLHTHYTEAVQRNTLVESYSTNLHNEIESHQIYLTSIEKSTIKDHEHAEFRRIMEDIHDVQRKELFKMRKEKTFTDEALRKAENILDLNDLQLTEARYYSGAHPDKGNKIERNN